MPFYSPTMSMTPLLLLSLALVLLSFSIKHTTLTQALCLPDQRHSLIQLKRGFKTHQLQSWNIATTDCCTWDGVTCDKQTSLVIALDLTNRSISGELNPALFNLTPLQYLNLAYNVFNNTPLPEIGFERLANLTYLNLSSAGFAGDVPIAISVLTNLISLDLSTNSLNFISFYKYEISLELSYNFNIFPIPMYNSFVLDGSRLQILLSNLTNLQFLYLDYVNISSNGSEWGKAVSQIGHTLEELSMICCSLTGPINPSLIQLKQLKLLQLDSNYLHSHVPIFFANFSSLSQLSLSGCQLRGHFPAEILHHTNLTELDLSYNDMLSGQLPEFTNESFLQYMSLTLTNFTGVIPSSIGNLQYLSILDLYCNTFYGEVPASIANLTRLTYVAFGENGFTGMIPMPLFSHPSLESLDLSNNQFTGYLSEFSNRSSTLRYIDLTYNNLQGKLPISLFKLPLLSSLFLTSNNFNGTFNLDIIKQSKSLIALDLSNNNISVTQGENRDKSFYASYPQIVGLSLASCSLTKFPSFLNYQTNIQSLDLSSNKISGVIPNSLWSNKALESLNLSHNFFTKMEWGASFISHKGLVFLDVHSNMITGSVPLVPPVLILDFSSNHFLLLPSNFSFSGYYLSLSNNRLTGEISLFIRNVSSENFEFLDLSYNNFTGKVPPCLLEDATAIGVINLRGNKLSGTFSRNISQGCGFRTIDLNGNRINGSLPQSLINCKYLEVLDLGNNEIRDKFPYFLGNLQNLRVLVLNSNQFYGTISNIDMNHRVNGSFFPMLKVLDLSSNYFDGTWPENFFGFLTGMTTNPYISDSNFSYLYRYAGNDLYYHDSVTVAFKGQDIDQERSLGIFSSLDLSNNEFSGQIPEEIGHLKFLYLLNLSRNAITGSIPSQLANLKQLESLDLSFNQLSGHIPQALTSLTFLETLNLSYNNLVGEIPQANQFLTFKNDSYLGNPGLCGSPLSVQCGAPPSNHGMNEFPSKSSSSDIPIGLSISIGVGFAVGFASVIWTLVSWENGRKWFYFNVDRFYFMHLYR